MIVLHVLIAFASIILAFATLLYPTANRFFINNIFIAATFISGIYLVIVHPAHMLHVCLAGTAYLTFTATISVMAHIRFSRMQKTQKGIKSA